LESINTQFKLNLSKSDLNQSHKSNCLPCTSGKAIRQAIHQTGDPQYKAEYPLHVLHTDLVGPITTANKRNAHPRCPTIGGSIYALIVTDGCTHAVWVRLLWNKSEASNALIALITQAQIRTGRIVERFHSDGGGEFRGSAFRSFLEKQGTRFTHTTASTPAHNGIAERMNRTLFEITRTLMFESSAPDEMWGEALIWAAHLYNVTPHQVTGLEVPFKQLYNYNFNVIRLRVWGCDAYVKVLPDKQSKIQCRTTPGIFVGFDYNSSSYRIMNPITKKIILSNDVTFYEHSFAQLKRVVTPSSLSRRNHSHINPFSSLEDLDDDDLHAHEDVEDDGGGIASNGVEVVNDRINPSDIHPTSTTCLKPIPPNRQPEQPVLLSSQPIQQTVANPAITVDLTKDDKAEEPPPHPDPPDPPSPSFETEENSVEYDYDEPEFDAPISNQTEAAEEPSESVGSTNPLRSREVRQLQALLTPFNSKHILPSEAPSDAPRTRYGRATRSSQSISSNPSNYYPADMHDALTNMAVEHAYAAVVDLVINREPKQYRDAIKSPDAKEWMEAMKEEMESMKRLGVWKTVPRPKGVTTLKGRWVYKNKLGDNNQLIRRKARFVAKGYLQIHGRDFFETHSPVAKMKSIKRILSLVAHLDLELYQIDFDTAFLNADVEEDIYMEQPEGFQKEGENMVCKLIKSIYGLKQASRNWNKEIDAFMRSIGYTPLVSDPCVYIKRTQSGKLIILSLYVDDTIAAFDKRNKAIWESDKKAIATHYAIKDLGECEWILNMKVTRDRKYKTILLSQEAYLDRIINEFDMETAKPTDNPAPIGDLYMPTDGTKPQPLDKQQIIKYQSMVGALLYAANITRIDIAFIVGQLCRYTAAPCNHHMNAAKRVFRYLRGTSEACLIFGSRPTNNTKLVDVSAYSDANWGSDSQTGKSVSGGLIRFNGDIINWYSKQQKSVAQSSAESEYMALAESVKEVLWFKSWVHEVLGQDICSIIKCDNTAAIQLSQNDSIHNRSKHINIRYHLVRDEVSKGSIRITWVGTQEQEADILTKALGTKLFTEQCDRLLLF
jgi:hypothetical protein